MSSKVQSETHKFLYYQAGNIRCNLDRIFDKDGKEIKLNQPLSDAERTQRNAACEDFFTRHYSIPSWGFKGILIPARTDGLKNFAKDLFLPMFIHYALRIDNFALKIFVSIGAIALDASTLVIRVVVTPFRALYNYYCPVTNPVKIEEFFELNGALSKAALHAEQEGFIQLGLETIEQITESKDKGQTKTTTKTRDIYVKLFSGWVDQSIDEGVTRTQYFDIDSRNKWTNTVKKPLGSH